MENKLCHCLQHPFVRVRRVSITCIILSSLMATPSFAGAQGTVNVNHSGASAVLTSSDSKTKRRSPRQHACEETNLHDAICAWGRLGDGRGDLVRCLSSEEASNLRRLSKRDERSNAEATVTPTRESSPVEVIINTVFFQGEHIASAKQNLATLAADYRNCILSHGGLRRASGELRIRFHVDPRGLARDASVSRRRFVSRQAGRCVARVVEHRFVGALKSKGTVGTLIMHFRHNAG
jgi:hypothetical protein